MAILKQIIQAALDAKKTPYEIEDGDFIFATRIKSPLNQLFFRIVVNEDNYKIHVYSLLDCSKHQDEILKLINNINHTINFTNLSLDENQGVLTYIYSTTVIGMKPTTKTIDWSIAIPIYVFDTFARALIDVSLGTKKAYTAYCEALDATGFYDDNGHFRLNHKRKM